MYRNLKEAVKMLKEEDPDCCVTEYALRQWCASGKLVIIYSGTTVKVQVKSLREFLENGDTPLSCKPNKETA